MTTVLLLSVAGSPGVTTTGLGLTLCWPRDVVLVDADPCPSRSVEAGHLRGQCETGRGLVGLAGALRRGDDPSTSLWHHLVELPLPAPLDPTSSAQGKAPQRWFLPGFSHRGQAVTLAPLWTAVADGLAGLAEAGVDTVVDLGRLDAAGPPGALVARADVIALVTRCTLRGLAAVSLAEEDLERVRSQATGAFGLILVGAGHPYSAREVSRQFGQPVLGEVTADPTAAAVLGEGSPAGRRWARGRYLASLRRTASQVRAAGQGRAGLVDATPAPTDDAAEVGS